jgi:glycosyltransferase involved in cell wall biosynthesis
MKALFISWDGPAQNYMESLFLPIFERLQGPDLSIHVLQFTWGEESIAESVAEAADRAGIGYDVRQVWRRPLKPATAAMIVKGAMDVVSVAREQEIDVLFPRSIIPGAMVLLADKMLSGVRLFFDADGFKADERVEFGGWDPAGVAYRLFRDIEAQVGRRADVVMTRTRHAKEILIDRVGSVLEPGRVHVIPNAKDTDQFAPGTELDRARIRRQLGVENGAPLVIYVGSLGPHYYPDRLVKYFELVHARDSDARFVVLTGNREVLEERLMGVDLPSEALTITRVAPEEVPRYIAAADLGVAFRQASFSQRGVCPIKVGEYLLCGTPVLSTTGVGDLDRQLDAPHVGRLVDDLEESTLEEAAAWLVEEVLPNRRDYREGARRLGVEEFGMEQCVERYRRAFADCRPN